MNTPDYDLHFCYFPPATKVEWACTWPNIQKDNSIKATFSYSQSKCTCEANGRKVDIVERFNWWNDICHVLDEYLWPEQCIMFYKEKIQDSSGT